MNAKREAQRLVARYKAILLDQDSDCGEEVLCTLIAKKIALATVDEIVVWEANSGVDWNQVKQEIETLE